MKIATRLYDGGTFAPVEPRPIPARLDRGEPPPTPWSDGPGLSVLSAPDAHRQKLDLPKDVRSAVQRLWRRKNGLKRKWVRRDPAAPPPIPIGRRSDVDAENLRLRQESPLVIVNAIDRGTCSFPMSLTGSDTGDHEFCGESIFVSPSKLSFCAHHLTVALLPRSPSYRLAMSTIVCDLPEIEPPPVPSILVIES